MSEGSSSSSRRPRSSTVSPAASRRSRSSAAALDTAALGPGLCSFDCANVIATSVAVPTPPRIEPDQACTCRASDISSEGPTGLSVAGATVVARRRAGRAGADSRALRRVPAGWLRVTMRVLLKVGGWLRTGLSKALYPPSPGFLSQDSTSAAKPQSGCASAGLASAEASPIRHRRPACLGVCPHESRLARCLPRVQNYTYL